MREHNEEQMYSEALLERLSIDRPHLVKSLNEHNLFYKYAATVYAIEDAISYSFGNLKLAYSLIASYEHRSDANASKEFHAGELTPVGLGITISTVVLLMLFLGLGTYFADDKDLDENYVKYYIVKLSPYLRDVLQAIKWAYKGLRSALSVVFYFIGNPEVMYNILLPISLGLAAVAVMNRIYIRSSRNARKEKQKENRAKCQKLFEKSSSIVFRTAPPKESEYEDLYQSSLIYITKDDGTPNEVHHVVRGDDGTYKLENLDIGNDIIKFDEAIRFFHSENICKSLSFHFIDDKHKKLYFLSELPITPQHVEPSLAERTFKVDLRYANSLIYLENPAIKSQIGLYEIDEQGFAKLSAKNANFQKKLAIERNDRQTLAIKPKQLEALILAANLNSKTNIDLSYEDWSKFKSETEETYTPETKDLISLFAAVILGSLLDGTYFYVGVLFITHLNPTAFITALSFAAVMIVTCLIARIYEEYDYQRTYTITQIEVKLAATQAECRMLGVEIERLIARSNDPELGGDERNQVLQDITKKIQLLKEEVKNYDKQQKELEKKVVFSRGSAFLEGLRNGLSSQGIISCLMFLSVTIMLLCGTTCPPVFLITMLAVSLGALIASTTRYIMCYRQYEQRIKPLGNISFAKFDSAQTDTDKLNALLGVKYSLDEREIEKPPDLYAQKKYEVARVGISGFTKAQKNFTEFSYMNPDHKDSWALMVVSLVFSIGMSVVFTFRGIKKMFSDSDKEDKTPKNKSLSSVPAEESDKSWYQQAMNFWSSPKVDPSSSTTLTQTTNISVNSYY
ncbi:MAG: hypothetical protein P1U74_03600 [Legionellaceae bacterium]|nr:hypothetical protein [Legionellaceae bacterium]